MIAIRRERSLYIYVAERDARRLLLVWHGEKKNLWRNFQELRRAAINSVFVPIFYVCSSGIYTHVQMQLLFLRRLNSPMWKKEVDLLLSVCTNICVFLVCSARWLIVSRNNIPSLFVWTGVRYSLWGWCHGSFLVVSVIYLSNQRRFSRKMRIEKVHGERDYNSLISLVMRRGAFNCLHLLAFTLCFVPL